MAQDIKIIAIECKFGPTSAYAYFIDAKEPVLIDTGIFSSASQEIATVLEENGYRIEDIRWILLTHGHVDHLGGAYAVWEKTNKQAKVVIPKKEAYLLKDRNAHIRDYEALQGPYVDEDTRERHREVLLRDIGDNIEPSLEVVDGEKIKIDGATSFTVMETPGHSVGSVTYLLNGYNYAFAADAVQIYGGAISGLPTIEDPTLYRKSIKRLLEVKPERLYLGHYFRGADGQAYDAVIEGENVERALKESLEMDQKLAATIRTHLYGKEDLKTESNSLYGRFQTIAEEIGYKADPRNLPCAFFVTMNGYEIELNAKENSNVL